MADTLSSSLVRPTRLPGALNPDAPPADVLFVGHATVGIRLDGVRFLTDPLLRGRLAHLARHHPVAPGALQAAPDAVLISHIHQDHLDFRSLDLLGKQVRLIVPRGAGRLVRRQGFHHVEELRVGDSVRIGAVRVQATPAVHSGFRPPFGPRAACLGFVLEGSQRVYFAGDTDLFDEMASLAPLDLALLPVWGWGPWIGPGHLDPARAARALTMLRPAAAMPIHWGSLFPYGFGRWRHRFLTRPPREFAALARALAPRVQVHVVEPGKRLLLREPGPAP